VITLHHCMSARSFRPLWALEETGIPYELVMLPFPPRLFARQYLEENSLGTVPLLVEGDVRMTESAAMCQYIAGRDPQRRIDVDPQDPAYPTYLNYLHHGEATLTFPQAIVLRYTRFEPEARRVPQAAEDYAKWFVARLRGLDAPLSRQLYLCGERFTAADISVGYALFLATHVGLDTRFSEPVRHYWDRLRTRPAFEASLAAQRRAAIAQGIDASPFPDPLATAVKPQ
jgi:glutathione S-transferase